jgi:hypothetical protein
VIDVVKHDAGDFVVRIVDGERERWFAGDSKRWFAGDSKRWFAGDSKRWFAGDSTDTEGWYATILMWDEDRVVSYEDTWTEPYSEAR